MAPLLDHKIPTIHLSNKMKPGTIPWLKTRNEVISALEEYGCFVAVSDEISVQLCDAVFEEFQTLFDLPTETKQRNKSEFKFVGYVGQIPILPRYESMGIASAHTSEGVANFTGLMWPNGNQAFCEKVHAYTKVAAEVEQTVARMVFEGYGVEKHFDSHLKLKNHVGRVTKYREAEPNESNLGIPSHTDRSFLSTIYQNGVNGLEVKAKDGDQWFTVDLISPSAIVVMAGDALMAWSSNRIKSPEHQVVVDGKEARYSFAQFSYLDGILKAPEELVDEQHPLRFTPFHHLDYIRFACMDQNRRLPCPIQTFCGLQRCGKSCRFRWKNYLDPEWERGDWSDNEIEPIVNPHKQHGNK